MNNKVEKEFIGKEFKSIEIVGSDAVIFNDTEGNSYKMYSSLGEQGSFLGRIIGDKDGTSLVYLLCGGEIIDVEISELDSRYATNDCVYADVPWVSYTLENYVTRTIFVWYGLGNNKYVPNSVVIEKVEKD